MKEAVSSQVHNSAAAPVSMPPVAIPGAAEYTKFVNDSVNRFTQMFEEFSRLQTQGAAQLTRAIDDGARMMKESLSYGQQLSEEFRKLSLENGKKAADLFNPKS